MLVISKIIVYNILNENNKYLNISKIKEKKLKILKNKIVK